MRFLMPLSVFVAVAAFQYALSASLESAEKGEVLTHDDTLTKLQKIDQVEFEAAQKAEAAQKNVTEEHSDDTRYLAAQEESVEEQTEATGSGKAQEAANSDTRAESESSEEVGARQEKKAETVSGADKDSQDLTKEQDVLE
ncbi:uncharacterized protein LOC142900533 isoform X1 [Nelusetta ayraudi]|uniref:uncharacterized protein LOC142900533 isoform X1 n=1 Tax=Nelusetta ayraudi TaxID=303726 RepID=UPI003F7176B9